MRGEEAPPPLPRGEGGALSHGPLILLLYFCLYVPFSLSFFFLPLFLFIDPISSFFSFPNYYYLFLSLLSSISIYFFSKCFFSVSAFPIMYPYVVCAFYNIVWFHSSIWRIIISLFYSTLHTWFQMRNEKRARKYAKNHSGLIHSRQSARKSNFTN